MFMKKELSQKDFAWVKWTPTKMKQMAELAMGYKKETYRKVKEILPEERTFLNTMLALDMSEGPYTGVFHFINILGEVSPKKEVRDAVHEILIEASEKMVDIEYDRDLYISALEYYEGAYTDEKKKLRKEDILLVEESMKGYKRAGFDKDEKTQKEIKKLLKRIGKLSQAFGKNLNDYDDHILCTKEELSGMSERFISSLEQDEKGKYMVTLAYPHLFPFLAEGENREKRRILAEKNLSKGGKKNLKLMEEIISLREQLARMLGYKHHGDYRTEDRMAKKAVNVANFQDSLLKKLVPLANGDIKELKTHAKTLGIQVLEHYDIPFVSNSLKKSLYTIDPETLRTYFPLPHVMNEMFKLAETLFGVAITQKEMALWHKDVMLFEIKNNKDLGGALVGYIAMDLYPREGKFGHAAMFGTIDAREEDYKSENHIAPMATIVCNFPAPKKKGKVFTPSLLSIGEVETFYHEFGHSLHHALSEVSLSSFAGTHVSWDFVETPSQFMENFVWNKEALKALSKHYETGESLSEEMIANVLGGKKFNNAYFFARQLIHGKIDMDIHTGKITDARKSYIEMNKKYFGITLPEDKTLFPAGFGHMVGYDAGYYSYLWALVYAQDAFSFFEKAMVKDVKKEKMLYGSEVKKVGAKWRREVLAKGSSEEEMELIKKFLGREPSDEAFLKEIGV
jgi:thimet oligopeptidase